MAVELATAYVSLVPSFKGGAAAIASELDPAAEAAGASSGKKSAGGFKNAFSGGLKAAGGAAAIFGGLNFLKDAFSLALDQAQLPNQLQQKFGLTASLAAESAKTASDLYAKGWGESLSQVADNVGTVDRALNELGTDDNTERVTAQAQALAKTFGQEVPEVVNAATQLVRTGMAPTMEAAFDTITAGFQSNADSGKDLLDTLVEYPAQFQKLGIDAPHALGLMNQALAAGARNSDFVADALKEFSIRAVDGSKTTAAGFQALGLSAEQMSAQIAKGGEPAAAGLQTVLDKLRAMKDPVAQSQAAVALFGTKAEDLGQSLYAMNPATVAATGGIDNVAGAAQRVSEQVGGTLQASLTGLSRTLQTGLASSLQLVVPLLQSFLGFIQPLLPILGPVAIAIGAITAAQWLWNAALAANPIVLIIAGIVAAIALIITNLDFFRGIWDSVWKFCSDLITTVVDWFKQRWQDVWNWLTGLWNGITGFFSGIWNGVVAGVRTAVEWIKSVWNGAIEGIKSFFRGFGSFVSGIWSGIGDGLKAALNWIIGKVNWVIDKVNWVTSKLPLVGDKLSIPHIPMLANGGVVTGPMLAMVGEGSEAEAVMPLSKLEQFVSGPGDASAGTDPQAVADAVGDALSGWSVQLDGNGLARLVNNANTRRKRRG